MKNVDVISAYNNVVDTFGDDDVIKYPLLDKNARIVFKSSVVFTSQRYYNEV